MTILVTYLATLCDKNSPFARVDLLHEIGNRVVVMMNDVFVNRESRDHAQVIYLCTYLPFRLFNYVSVNDFIPNVITRLHNLENLSS